MDVNVPPMQLSCYDRFRLLGNEIWFSTDLLFQSKLTWLLVLGPLALFGDSTGMFGEAMCFAFAGLALIPCAERLSFVTEQVAGHTNGTIGALLNATFGNAPELLISTAALRSGFYRVVQLAMLGSMLTNLLFVFGVSCLVGGLRWQVQELRITSGNVSVLMLLMGTAGSLFPAALSMSGQMKHADSPEGVPSDDELMFCRVNAFVLMFMYLCYLLFQLGTHKDEFDEEDNVVETPEHLLLMTPHFNSRKPGRRHSQRNTFFLRLIGADVPEANYSSVEMMEQGNKNGSQFRDEEIVALDSSSADEEIDLQPMTPSSASSSSSSLENRRRRREGNRSWGNEEDVGVPPNANSAFQDNLNNRSGKSHESDENQNGAAGVMRTRSGEASIEPQMSFRVGIVWLFIITLCISAMSDILVDTIDGFADRLNLSEVFTSMVIVPFFSNVAEQVSAILFAYRNEMDLCVGVTVGSAIQIAMFVLPGCVLIGGLIGRSMTLFFHGYETCCLFLGVIVVAAVLQGGTTNWLVGMSLIGIYIMLATGFWFHEIEDLSVDAEDLYKNQTRHLL